MSEFKGEYKQFFESPAGLELLTYLRNQLETEHELAEKSPDRAAWHSCTAKAYRDILSYIDIVMIDTSLSETSK